MFNCSECKQVIGPRVKPIKVVTGTRPVAYHNEYTVEDEWGNEQRREVDSVGVEITGEQLRCAACADTQPSIVSALALIGARGFQEKLAEPLRVKFIGFAVQSMLARLGHNGTRAKRDTEFTIPNIKLFVDENKDLRF